MSINKTQLGLNRWTASEKPLMAEFNSDNQIIDEKLRELTSKKADIKNTEIYTLSLDNGILPYFKCYYTINPFGQVTVILSVTSTEAMKNNRVLATLPEGFRPIDSIEGPCTVGAVGATGYDVGTYLIETSGRIKLQHKANFQVGSAYIGSISFPKK